VTGTPNASLDRWGERLPRQLGLWSAIALVIGSTIGSGIFRVPARIAERVPEAGPMLIVWVAGGLLTLCGALTYAELAGMYPRSGGIYVFVREGWGRGAGFVYGWSELLVIRASSLGAIATVCAEYLMRSLGFDPTLPENSAAVHYVAAGAIMVVTLLNYVGARRAAAMVNLTTGAKYGALVALFLGAFILGDGEFAHFGESTGPLRADLAGLALISVLWAYDGFADLSRVGGEIREPERTLPRALVLGTLAIIVIYLVVNVAYLYLLPLEAIQRSPLVAADAAEAIVGRAGAALIGVVVIVSTFGALVSVMFTSPRIFFAMAEDRLFFRGLAAVHPRFQTPGRAILLTGAVSISFVLVRTFEGLSDTFVLATWPFYALAAASVFVLRRRRPDAPRPVRVNGYPLVPLLFIGAAALILGNALISSPRDPAIAFGVILSGIPAYLIWRRFGSAP
jgi:amino acid transporter